jgi:hypothetical protein
VDGVLILKWLDVREIGWMYVNLIPLALDGDRSRTFVNTVIDRWFRKVMSMVFKLSMTT